MRVGSGHVGEDDGDDLADVTRRFGCLRQGRTACLAESGSLGIRLGARRADPHRCIVVPDDDPARPRADGAARRFRDREASDTAVRAFGRFESASPLSNPRLGVSRRGHGGLSQPAATSEPDRPGVARSVASASRTWAARPSASSRSTRRRSAHGPVVHEPLPGDAEDPHRDVAIRRIGQPRLLDQFEHAAPEPAHDDALLERHEHPLAARLVEDQLPIERPREPGVDDADRPALRRPAGRPPRPPAPRSARSRRTAGRGPRAGPRPGRSAGSRASRAPARTRHRAGSAARTGGPGPARSATATAAPARPSATR